MASHHRSASCFTCQSRDRSEWCAVEGNDLRMLNQVKVANLYQPGQIIFYQGNPCLGVYCIEAGTVAVRKTDAQGNSVITRLAHGGDTLGYRAFFGGGPYQSSAEALTPTKVCFVDKAAVRHLLDHSPAVGSAFLKHMAHDLEAAEVAKLLDATLSVRARLAHLLLVLRERFGSVDSEGVLTIELPLSRQDVAAMIGTRPETVARAVRSMEDAGIAQFSGRTVKVDDLDELLDEIEAV